jgi:uncharacterized repeat protein (TIGR02543 family)
VALSKVYSANTTIYAHWAENAVQPVTYTLTISATSGGTVSPAAGVHSYADGTSVTVTATANSGYTFKNWSGASTSTSATATITMNGNKTLTANFELSGTQDPCANNPTPNCPDYCTRASLVSNISDGVESNRWNLNELGDGDYWVYKNYWDLMLLDSDADAAYTVSGDELTINVTGVGPENWHVLIQQGVPLIYGKSYILSFEARMETNRDSSKIHVNLNGEKCNNVEGCDGTYIDWNGIEDNGKYGWQNANFALTTSWQSFSYKFNMKNPDDLHGQIEIAVGYSTGTVKIRNIKFKPADCR